MIPIDPSAVRFPWMRLLLVVAVTAMVVAGPRCLKAQPQTYVYVANFSSSNISQFSFNETTGVATLVGPTVFSGGTGPFALAVVPSPLELFVANEASNTLSCFSINPTTGAI